MSSPKKKTAESISFVKNTNPEAFHVHPRPGGLLPIDKSLEFNESDFAATSTKIGDDLFVAQDFSFRLNENISRDFRVHSALDDTQSCDSEDATIPNASKDTMFMAGVAMSTVIMLASKFPNIPEEYIRFTTQCLEHVRDDFGNHPPNVQSLLNHLKNRPAGGASPEYTTSGGAADISAKDVIEEQNYETATGDESGAPEETQGGENVESAEGGGLSEEPIGQTAEGEDLFVTAEDEGGDQTVRTTTRVSLG